MEEIKLLHKVKEEVEKLLDDVVYYNDRQLKLDEICKELFGFNVTETCFDFDYGSATHTMNKDEHGKLKLQLYGIALWDEEGQYVGSFDYTEILKKLKGEN